MLFAVRRVHEVMGMPVTVNVAGDDVDPGVLEAVFADFQHLDEMFSPFIETSEVSRIDRGELDPFDHAIIPDRIEAGTYIVAAAATGGDVLVQGAELSDLWRSRQFEYTWLRTAAGRYTDFW